MSSFEEIMLENARKRRGVIGKVFGPKERETPVYTGRSISDMFKDGKYVPPEEHSSSEE